MLLSASNTFLAAKSPWTIRLADKCDIPFAIWYDQEIKSCEDPKTDLVEKGGLFRNSHENQGYSLLNLNPVCYFSSNFFHKAQKIKIGASYLNGLLFMKKKQF